MAEDENDGFEDEEYEYEEVEEEVFEDGAEEADPDFEDADFGDDDDAFGGDDDGFGDDGDGWGDDDVDVTADQQYIPISKSQPEEDDEETFELDKDGNIITPKAGGLKRQKSVDIQCWKCTNCEAINKLSWTLTKFAMKCCMCKQDTYAPTVKIFDSDTWDEPSNDFWECIHCTLHNNIGANDCQACQKPNGKYMEQDDDEDNGDGLFIKGEESDDDDDDDMHGMHHHHGGSPHGRMGGGGGGGRAGMRGMDPRMMGGGRMGGGMDFFGMMSGAMSGMMGGRGGRRKKIRETRPVDKKKEANLRNLLIVGFIRKCDAPQLPTKFFDYFNLYYQAFDKWNWDFFRSSWTSKKNDILTIKRGKRFNSKWKNMYGAKHIKMDPRKEKYPNKFSWKLRILDRKQIEPSKKDENEDETTSKIKTKEEEEREKKKKESFEIQYMDVIVGVVNSEKMPQQELPKAFNQYSCGYALFAGNGKIFKNNDWIRVFKPIKHEDTITINLEWMTIGEYKGLYASEQEIEQMKKSKEDEYCIALTFNKNDETSRYPKGAAFMIKEWSAPYKLAISSAKKRWEIEWVNSGWVDQRKAIKNGTIDDDDDDDIKDDK